MKETFEYQSREGRTVSKYPSGDEVTQTARFSARARRYIDGVQNPTFRQKILNGQDATTSLRAGMESYKISSQPYYTVVQPNRVSHSSNNWGDPFTYAKTAAMTSYKEIAPLIRAADAIALAKVHDKVSEYQNPFQGLVFAGELKEVVGLLRNPFEKIAQLIRSLLEAKNRRLSVADSWLEFRFAILPLIADIQAILSVAERKANMGQSVQFKGYGKSVTTHHDANPNVSPIYGRIVQRKMQWTATAEVIYHTAIEASHLRQVLSINDSLWESLSAKHIVPAVWELVPWSFLIDYVVNIGSILEATFEGEFRTKYCVRSVIVTRSAMLTFSKETFLSGYSGSSNGYPTFSYTNRAVEREARPLGIPPLVFSAPGHNIQKLNIAALLTSLTVTKRG